MLVTFLPPFIPAIASLSIDNITNIEIAILSKLFRFHIIIILFTRTQFIEEVYLLLFLWCLSSQKGQHREVGKL